MVRTASPAESPTPALLKKVITTTACRENDGVDMRRERTYLIHIPPFPAWDLQTRTHALTALQIFPWRRIKRAAHISKWKSYPFINEPFNMQPSLFYPRKIRVWVFYWQRRLVVSWQITSVMKLTTHKMTKSGLLFPSAGALWARFALITKQGQI